MKYFSIRTKTLIGVALLLGASVAQGGMVRLEANEDTTIFRNSGYATIHLSNGMGQHVFAGVTGQGGGEEIRRGLIGFDLAGQIPLGAMIDEVTVGLTVSRAPPGAANADFTLHRATTDWGEGASDATGVEGTGARAQPGDASWVYSSYMDTTWTTEGGDFLADVVSASASIGGLGTYAFTGAGLAADVQFWIDHPGSNFGWFLLGDEGGVKNARRFYSHDQLPESRPSGGGGFPLPPVLSVTYHLIPEASTVSLLVCGVGSLLWWRRRGPNRK